MLTYGSVCSGIEAASVAWEPLGWRPVWFAEIEPFPAAVLACRWPQVVNLGDMTQIAAGIRAGLIEAPDVLVGGTPCQAFSVAGLRGGLDDARGQLTLAFVELVNAIDEKRKEQGKPPVIVVWENVPGVLSSKDNAFGCFLAGLVGEDVELQPTGKKWTNAGGVYGPARAIAWRILDAQFFGVAQRRRRVFVVASARADFYPAKVLFEFDRLRRDTPPSREAGETTTKNAGGRVINGSHWDGAHNPHPTLNQSFNTGGIGASNQEIFSQRGAGLVGAYRLVAFGQYADDETSSTVKARDYKDATDLAVMAVHGTQDPCVNINFAHTLGRNQGQENALCYGFKAGQGAKAGGIGWAEEQSPTLTAADCGLNRSPAIAYSGFDVLGTLASEVAKETDLHTPLRARVPGQFENSTVTMLADGVAVRRLTPVECERLQGFPDNHTLIPTAKRKKITEEEYKYIRHHIPNLTAEDAYKLAKDGPRYKAIGNSMAVPVMHWIGKQIHNYLYEAA
ncbi:DNA cytosine methyltransferase [Salmonella enterica]|nr:DNA cytosine methyltransferase [Salmonella enterica]